MKEPVMYLLTLQTGKEKLYWAVTEGISLKSNSNSLTLLTYHYYQKGLTPIKSNNKMKKPPGLKSGRAI